MAALELLRYLAWRHAAFLLAAAVVLAGFQFLICAAVGSVDVAGALETLASSLPPLLQSVIASHFLGGFSAQGLLAFGWDHPVAHALGAAAAILLATHAVAGEAESGAMELLLSQPFSRTIWLASQVGFALFAIAVVTAAGLAGSLLGQRVFQLAGFEPGALARLALDYAALQSACLGITLLLSVLGREAGRVASAGFLIVLLSYLAHAIGRLWAAAAFVLPWTLQHYYAPQSILIRGEGIGGSLAVLGGVFASTVAIAAWRFRTRDLP